MNAIPRLLTLSAEAWVEIVVCRARLRLPRLLGAERLLRRELAAEPLASSRARSLDRLLRAFARGLSAQPGIPGCLARSLALRRFLARHGEAGQLKLGLQKNAGRMRGHAWVEAGGGVVSNDEAFVRTFLRLESGASRSGSSDGRNDG